MSASFVYVNSYLNFFDITVKQKEIILCVLNTSKISIDNDKLGKERKSGTNK